MASLKASQILLIIWASFIAILMPGTPHVYAAVLDGAMPELHPGRSLLSAYNTAGRSGYNSAGSNGYNTAGRSGYNSAGSNGYNTAGRGGYNRRLLNVYNTAGRGGYNTAGRGGYN